VAIDPFSSNLEGFLTNQKLTLALPYADLATNNAALALLAASATLSFTAALTFRMLSLASPLSLATLFIFHSKKPLGSSAIFVSLYFLFFSRIFYS
jgi:hypothetical protein